ncbi:hypothetical protein A3A40_03160 [Candidatus Kaiserbacteria bacterium RIFCSPLOWO2_01_FULL_54_20]|uniref:Uncharacterized protein n=1 Tax=Candidatus Kaiserbacteria bacterium RIFCSPLOWO2_01_FULL_54_20 TaxID=1798513 RepID=A0A1F6EKH2_9BACT|nr:MAG: hypothetical protein A3A40_03160 [Candidatus Kaiserbacteria bacterium RIFCSPLOWO2_01_FULL_54_20]
MTLRLPLILLLAFALAVPFVSHAAKLTTGNESCIPVYEECGCSQRKNSKGQCVPGINRWKCQCDETPPGGKVTAICVHQLDCKGTGTEKGGLGDAKGFLDIIKGVMDLLKPKEQPQSPQQQQQPQTGTQGCTKYYQVTTPSTDPCAYYVPPTSTSLLNTPTGTQQNNLTSELLNALSGGTGNGLDNVFGEEGSGGSGSGGNVSDLLNGITGDNEDESTTTSTRDSTTATATTSDGRVDYTGTKGKGVNVQSGTRGDIEVTGTGATVVAGARDSEANTEVAGFYGGDAMGGQPQGVVANMCRNRPWADSIVTYVIPPSFFDSLCVWRGYQVGVPKAPSPPVLNQQVKQGTTSPATPKVQLPSEPAEVEIWAVPERVPLGTRTSVFWNTRGVESCTVTSPDGSFNESTLSGGASTVPLTGPTTFTISCLTQDNKPVTDYVIVNLTI